jgi:hypothetical protein
MKKAMSYILTLAGLLLAANASAATYHYDRSNGSLGGGSGGTFDSISSSYNTTTNQLDWTITNAQITGSGAVDGFWLVLSSGPNPKSSDKQLSIVYADFNSNTLLAYTYNGLNSASSITSPGVLIGDYSSSIINTGNTIGFSIDTTYMNDVFYNTESDWEGMQYDENIGVWFHTSYGTTIAGNENDGYTFGYQTQRWYDTSNETTVVPIPAALFLFAPALAGFATMRRKLALAK